MCLLHKKMKNKTTSTHTAVPNYSARFFVLLEQGLRSTFHLYNHPELQVKELEVFTIIHLKQFKMNLKSIIINKKKYVHFISFSVGLETRRMNHSNSFSKKVTYLNKYLAHTMQWMGSEGVFRIVQPGKVF